MYVSTYTYKTSYTYKTHSIMQKWHRGVRSLIPKTFVISKNNKFYNHKKETKTYTHGGVVGTKTMANHIKWPLHESHIIFCSDFAK